MSYCRWSSDNWMSDIYCYNGGPNEDDDLYIIHVAGRRRARAPIPSAPMHWLGPIVRWAGAEWNKIRREMEYGSRIKGAIARAAAWLWTQTNRLSMWHLHRIPLVPIGLPHDGETFEEPDPLSCCNRLIELRRMGYNVPQYAIDQLMAEANEGR